MGCGQSQISPLIYPVAGSEKGVALVIILILFINIFICALQFWQINSYASMLLVPYLIWVGFASALTMSIWQLNSPYAQPSSRRQRSVSDPHQQ
ncbi:unnamed protein product [Rotaria magnacalcarata]